MTHNLIKTLAAVSLASGLALGATAAHADPGIGLTRVSANDIAHVRGLTADYVRTPYGYFHATCVQRIDPTEQLQADGSILRADGNTRQVAQCHYPHFLPSGVRVEASEDATHLPQTYNGYLQLVSTTLATAASRLIADMIVPANPTSKTGQTLYYFPGLEDAKNVVTILQPVLGWNGYGVNNWTIASWNCCKSGTTYVGNHVTVLPGDVIHGEMAHKNGQHWTITATDQTQTTLPAATLSTNGYQQNFNWVFAAALETYGVRTCNQFPVGGPIRFIHIKAFVGGKIVSSPNWAIQPGSDPMTRCTGATVRNPWEVDISY